MRRRRGGTSIAAAESKSTWSDTRPAVAGTPQAGNHFEQRRLARATRTDDGGGTSADGFRNGEAEIARGKLDVEHESAARTRWRLHGHDAARRFEAHTAMKAMTSTMNSTTSAAWSCPVSVSV